jgi:hypothetical protein
MSDELYAKARLTRDQREEIELLEMKACLALLDDQIVQLRRFRGFHSDGEMAPGAEYHALMASVAYSTKLARQLNAKAAQTLWERGLRG